MRERASLLLLLLLRRCCSSAYCGWVSIDIGRGVGAELLVGLGHPWCSVILLGMGEGGGLGRVCKGA